MYVQVQTCRVKSYSSSRILSCSMVSTTTDISDMVKVNASIVMQSLLRICMVSLGSPPLLDVCVIICARFICSLWGIGNLGLLLLCSN